MLSRMPGTTPGAGRSPIGGGALMVCLFAALAACSGDVSGDDGGFGTPDGGIADPDVTVSTDTGTEPTGCESHDGCMTQLADELAACQAARCADDGQCVIVVAEDGATCDDQAPCTQDDVCAAGTCKGVPRSCDDDNPCTEDSCDPKETDSPCIHLTLVGDCDDGDFCTTDDVCSEGECVGAVTDCSDMDGDCSVGSCDPSNGACKSLVSEDGAACDDGVPCTSLDQCTGGQCAGTVTDCSHLNSLCAAGHCDPETGECLGLLINEGGACDDGDACTLVDTCLDGACGGAAVDCTALDDGCNVGACTDGLCAAEPAPVGTACDDGDLCTDGDVCAGGECLSGDLTQCDDGLACNGLEVCAADTGECVSGTASECDDGNQCNGVETCDDANGGCLPGIPVICDDGDPCNGFESCVNETGECLSGDPIVCDDGNPCDGLETCEVGSGACLPGQPIACDDEDACNGIEVCDVGTGDCLPGDAITCDDGLPCNGEETCDAATGDCLLGEAVQCDDEDACNGLEACDVATGECYSGASIECDDGDLCNGIEGCDPATGACLPGEEPACDDEDACNGLETCDEATGACLNGEPVLCDDGLPCNGVEGCAPDTGVCLPGNSLICDDGLPCNGAESCQDDQGGCVDGEPVDCPDDNPCDGVTACEVATGNCVTGPPLACGDEEPCNGEEFCDAATGGCADGPALDCDDGLLCTDDACEAGLGCVHVLNPACECATIADCAPLQTPGLCDGSLDCFDGQCLVDPLTEELCDTSADAICEVTGCNLETGFCETLPDTGSQCGDGDLCTVQDSCLEGECVGVPRDCSFLDEPCAVGTCQPADGACEPVGFDEGAACWGGSPCVEGETCSAGDCGNGTDVDCSGLDSACAVGTCSVDHGGCIGDPINEAGVCDDFNACTLSDVCALGVCSGEAKNCDLEEQDCVSGGCDPASGECVVVPIDESDECDDDDVCTTEDLCAEGTCVGTPVDCADGAGVCENASCDPATGCEFTPLDDGQVCDDGDACTTETSCLSGACLGVAVDCSEEPVGPCEVVSCDPAWGACVVSQVADDTPCDDEDFCTTGEVCSAGACIGEPVVCTGSPDTCAVHVCDPGTGSCVATSVGEGETCEDGNPCTDGDLCQAGACVGQPLDCGGGGACALASCDPESGGCVLTAFDDGTSCSDANQCTTNDACTAGQCVGQTVVCESEESCTLVSCDPTTGECTITAPIADGTPCGDGTICDGQGTCLGGSCDQDSPLVCPEPSAPCMVAYCDDTVGGCIEGPAADGASCDDNDPCTSGDICTGGACGGQVDPDCGGVPVLCEASGHAGTYGHCEIHVARRCDGVPPTGTFQAYFSWDPEVVQVVYFTDSGQDPNQQPPFADPLYQTYPSYMSSFAAPGYYPTCTAHPTLPEICLSYTHLYNSGPGDSSDDWPGNMTIFVYTNGPPEPIVDGVLDATGQPTGDTLVFHLHYRLEADVDVANPTPIQLTELVADDLDTVPLSPTFEDGVIVLDYPTTVCP